MSTLSLLARVARMDLVRAALDADGGGALHLYTAPMIDSPDDDPAGAPLAIVVLATPCGTTGFTGDDAQLLFDVPLTGTVAVSGTVAWALFVDGAGAGVLVAPVGEPGSLQPIIIDSAEVFQGGEVTVLAMDFRE